MAATPLVEKLPSTESWAMRNDFGWFSSNSERARIFFGIPRPLFVDDVGEEAQVDPLGDLQVAWQHATE